MHSNIENQPIPWLVAFLLWLLFGIASGYLGDYTYNANLPYLNTFALRLVALTAIIAVIALAAFLFAKVAFLVASAW